MIPAEAERRRPTIRWSRWFLIVAVPWGLFLVVATPPLQEPDAAAHLVRMDQFVHGVITEPIDSKGQVAPMVDGCLTGFIDHHAARAASPLALHPTDNWSAVRCSTPRRWRIDNSALTSPIPYLTGAVGYGAVDIVGGGVNVRYLAARLTGLAAYLLAAWAAIRFAPRGRGVLFAVAVLPSSLSLAASLHADTTGIWAALLAVSMVLRLTDGQTRPRRRELAALATLVTVLALSKNLYSPFILLLLLVPAATFTTKRARWTYVGGVGGFAALLGGIWAAYASKIRYQIQAFGIDSQAAIDHIVHHPVSFIQASWSGLLHPMMRHDTIPGIVQTLGAGRHSKVPPVFGDVAPLPIAIFACALIVTAMLADPGITHRSRRARRTTTLVAWIIACSCTALIFLGIAVTANPPGAPTILWVQGRYFLPLLPLAAFSHIRRPRLQPVASRIVPIGSLALLCWMTMRLVVIFY